MEKITKKLIKGFLLITALVAILSFLTSSIFLSKFHVENQYDQLKSKIGNVCNAIMEGTPYQNIDATGIIITKDSVHSIGKNRMAVMGFLHSKDINSIGEKGTFKHHMGEEYLYYRMDTGIGTIVLFENMKATTDYIRVINIVLSLVFLMALIVCIPFILIWGKKFTAPILKLQKSSYDISNGNFKTDIVVETGDEIEELSLCLKNMAIKLEEKYSMQRDFIANVSHDFKTPLSIIRNYSEAINDGLVDLESAQKYSKDIIDEVDKLNNLVMDILQLSKLQEGKVKLNKSEFNIYEFSNSLINKFKYKAQEKNIFIDLVFDISKDIVICGDKIALERVLYNFMDNAIKFSPDLSKIELYVKYTNNGIMVSVKDSGLGIEEDMIHEIWNRYHKHSQSGGMGLGLPICSEILKLHNFDYGVNSKLGSGSEFYFIISKDYYSK
ncbi:HAMP domain-containing histidine kinase [Clostridium sp. MSJ-11]|uniref:histidine kinase n=1 Tax=Clostridium mobile TaxID=2841512 RepID=A0ABS6EPA2_9CLOT|nr:HAMP domain-containing sensor histidine kinase [Clostridium mobile]MBU5486220.1 HAMP domain-containing histidine kinase [Clostridium mobile]